MKIIFIGRYNDTEILNGPEKFAKRIFHLITKKEYEVFFIEYFFDGKQYSIWEKLFGYQVKRDGRIIVLRLGIIPILLKIIKFNPQIIHILTFERFSIIVFLISFLMKIKVVYTVHSIFYYEKLRAIEKSTKLFLLKNKICEHLILTFASELIFVSDSTIELAKNYYRINKKKITVIPHGIDSIFFNPNRKFNIDKIIKIVFFNGISSGIDRKLINIIEVLNKFKRFPIILFVIGEKFNNRVKVNFDIVYQEPLNTNLLAEFFKDKHFFLKSSIFDSFSIMSIEAMASGMICLISDMVGMKFIIKNEFNGFIYDKNNKESIIEIFNKIAEKKINLNQISANATQVYHSFKWDNTISSYISIYKKLTTKIKQTGLIF